MTTSSFCSQVFPLAPFTRHALTFVSGAAFIVMINKHLNQNVSLKLRSLLLNTLFGMANLMDGYHRFRFGRTHEVAKFSIVTGVLQLTGSATAFLHIMANMYRESSKTERSL